MVCLALEQQVSMMIDGIPNRPKPIFTKRALLGSIKKTGTSTLRRPIKCVFHAIILIFGTIWMYLEDLCKW